VLIYKILRPAEWQDFEASGRFDGSLDDRRDGFIHCSSRPQLETTAAQYFSAEPEFVVVAIDTGLISAEIRWEPASNGELFPHVFGDLSMSAVAEWHRVHDVASIAEALRDA
jgi:uncharacterized protein (DUF952 family)